MKKDKRPAVVLRLAEGEKGAWSRFLEEYAPIIFQVIRLFEEDEDRRSECFLYICEHLRRHRFRRLRRFRPDGPASFTTWLRAVTRNLYLDWRRSRFGRRSWMRVAAELPTVEREAYRLQVQQGMTLTETLGALQLLYPNLSKVELLGALDRLEAALGSNSTIRYRSRRPTMISLTRDAEGSNGPSERPVRDPKPNPEGIALLNESHARLTAGLSRLPGRDQLLLRLRFEEELTLAEVARLIGLDNPQAADRQIRKALDRLRGRMD